MGDDALPARDALLEVGLLGKPHGVRGEVTFRPFGSWPAGVVLERARPQVVWLERERGLRAMRVEALRRAGDHWVFRLDGLSSREAAAALSGSRAFVARADLPQLAAGEFYVADTVGLEVRETSGKILGRVTSTFWNGAQDVAVLEAEGGERLIPLVPAVVQRVEPRAGFMEVLWEEDESADNAS